jgi:U3 small nucleolar RNA-associated protein 20
VKEIKRNDCFILQEEPKRRGALTAATVKLNKQTNTYVLVEFGLEMLHIMMKKKRFIENEQFFDPLVPLLFDSLRSNFIRVSMFAVRCISIIWHHQLELENLKKFADQIAVEVFNILHKYATTEISRKDNHYLLVKSCFKCVLTLLKHVDYYTMNSNQLKALLLYIEQDLLTANDKDTISFVLLKAIIDRKLIVPEIAEIMRKIAEISITSDIEERRNAIRPIILTYLMEYPLGKKIDSLLKFFIAQLNYEEINGRESAVAMMCLIFKGFPEVRKIFKFDF